MAINGRFVCPGDELNTKKEAKTRRNAKEPSNIGLELGIIQQRWSTWAKQEMDRPRCPTATATAGPGSCNAARATHTDINGGIIRDATNGSDSISLALFVVVLGFFRFALARSVGATLCHRRCCIYGTVALSTARNRIRKNKFGADTNGKRRIKPARKGQRGMCSEDEPGDEEDDEDVVVTEVLLLYRHES